MYDNLTHNDLVKIIEEYKHRIAMIKDDVKAIYKCMNLDEDLSRCMASSCCDYVPDTCLHYIDIACDLSSNESLEWTQYSNL